MADQGTEADFEDSLYGDLVAPANGQGNVLLLSELDAVRAENQMQAQRLCESEKQKEALASEVSSRESQHLKDWDHYAVAMIFMTGTADTALQIEALRAQNAVLITNISSLFKTAKLELERKNRDIEIVRNAQQHKRGL